MRRSWLMLLFALLLSALLGCQKEAPTPMFDDPDPSVRRKSVVRLNVDTAPAHADDILRLLRHDPDPDVRATAMSAVGLTRDPRAVEDVAAYLVEPGGFHPWRLDALNALLAIGGPRAGRIVIDTYLAEPEDSPLFRHLKNALALRNDEWYGLLLQSTAVRPERVSAVADLRR